jgi:hypothetical protein
MWGIPKNQLLVTFVDRGMEVQAIDMGVKIIPMHPVAGIIPIILKVRISHV